MSKIYEKLNLELNKKSKYFPNTLGINFCGYIIHESYILIRKRSKQKINKNIKNGIDYMIIIN